MGKWCVLLVLCITLSRVFLMTLFVAHGLTGLICSRRWSSLCYLWNTGAFLKSFHVLLEQLCQLQLFVGLGLRFITDMLLVEPLLVGGTLWKKMLCLILRIFTKFFLLKFSLWFYGFPPQVRFILCNCVQSGEELKAFKQNILWVSSTPDKFNQKQLFTSFCSKCQTDFSRKACVCALFFFLLFVFSLSVFVLNMSGQKLYFCWCHRLFFLDPYIPIGSQEINQKQNPQP